MLIMIFSLVFIDLFPPKMAIHGSNPAQARERSLSSSLADTGGSIGGLLALAAGPVVANQLGWKACFAKASEVFSVFSHCQWIGFVGKILTGNPWVLHVFTIKYRGFRLKFSHHPIL